MSAYVNINLRYVSLGFIAVSQTKGKRGMEMSGKKNNHDVFRVLCLFVGIWLDELLGTEIFIFIFLVLGILTAYKSLYDYTRPLLKGEKERENEKFWNNRKHKK